MAWRDVQPVDAWLLGEEEQERLGKLAALVKRLRAENPVWRPLGLKGDTECPICAGVAHWTITAAGGLYVDCSTMGCVRLHSRPSPQDLRRPAAPDRQGRLL